MNDMNTFGIGIVTGILVALVLTFSFYDDIPWVPSKTQAVNTMLQLANPQPGELVVDLGAGNGQILFRAVEIYQAKALGVEISPLLFILICIKSWLFGMQKQVHAQLGDLHGIDLRQADVVTLYLTPTVIEKLREKLEYELKPGSRVVSNMFPIDNWTPMVREGNIYLYQR